MYSIVHVAIDVNATVIKRTWIQMAFKMRPPGIMVEDTILGAALLLLISGFAFMWVIPAVHGESENPCMEAHWMALGKEKKDLQR